MLPRIILHFALFFLFLFTNPGYGSDWPVLKGPYLGQKPPGLTPEIFAPGVISGKLSEGCSGWGNNMEFFIFQRWINRIPKLYITYQKNGVWTVPRELAFGQEYRAGDFTLAPDGKTLYFASRIHFKKDGDQGEGCNIWVTSREKAGWSRPEPVGPPVNTMYHDSYPSVAANGNLYFFSRKPGGWGKSDLYLAEFTNGKYLEPTNLGKILNTAEHEWDTYIAPDESYIIYCSMKPGGLGEDDLYISFRNKKGKWSRSLHLGDKINTKESENRPYVSPDGKYLFYTSTSTGIRDIYWVSAQILEKLRKNKGK